MSLQPTPVVSTTEPCPPDHISSCRYIIMMHPPRTETSIDISDLVKIASNDLPPSSASVKFQDPTWFKLITTQHQTLNPAPHELRPATVGNLTWYSTTMDPRTASLIQQQHHKHEIKYMIPDLPVKMYGHIQKHPPSWGLDRIDQRKDKLDGLFHYPTSSGENTTIYIIDT
jgi:hypothetical protein